MVLILKVILYYTAIEALSFIFVRFRSPYKYAWAPVSLGLGIVFFGPLVGISLWVAHRIVALWATIHK